MASTPQFITSEIPRASTAAFIAGLAVLRGKAINANTIVMRRTGLASATARASVTATRQRRKPPATKAATITATLPHTARLTKDCIVTYESG